MRKRGKSIYTDAQVDHIRRLIGEGKSLREVSEATGIPKTSVYYLARKHNIKPPPSTRQAFDYDQIVKLRRRGLGVSAIAGEVGCSLATVSKALRLAGMGSAKKRIHTYPRSKRERIAHLYLTGANLDHIAKVEGIAIKSARKIILGEGVAIRAPGGGAKRTMEELAVLDRWRLASSEDDDETWEHITTGQTCVITDRGQACVDDRFVVLDPDLGGYRSRDEALDAVEAHK
jgi:hypothetical protein